MKDLLGVSPSKGNQGTTRGKEKLRVHMNVVPRSTMNTNGGTEN